MIARWQPVHRGHAAVLRGLCRCADQVLIGIGSSNEYDFRNPFTLEERTAMLELVLQPFQNVQLIPVPDLHNGPRWRLMVLKLFGQLDAFVSDNPYVVSLLGEDYRIIRPVEFVAEEEKFVVDGSQVRREMARYRDWTGLVPKEIAAYILENHLDARFRYEFGLQTLTLDTIIS